MPLARRGFTLIELLFVLVIIALLVGIALPKYQVSKTRAYVRAMESDLRNVMAVQATYVTSGNAYTADLTALNFGPTKGNTLSIPEATANGWIARVTNPGAVGVECVVFVGTVGTATSPATTEGKITCVP